MNLNILQKLGFDASWANDMIKNTLLKDGVTKSVVLSLDENGEAKITSLPYDILEDSKKKLERLIELSNKLKEMKNAN